MNSKDEKTSALPSSMDENWRNPTAIILYYFSITLSIKYFVKQLLTIHNVGSFLFWKNAWKKAVGKIFKSYIIYFKKDGDEVE